MRYYKGLGRREQDLDSSSLAMVSSLASVVEKFRKFLVMAYNKARRGQGKRASIPPGWPGLDSRLLSRGLIARELMIRQLTRWATGEKIGRETS